MNTIKIENLKKEYNNVTVLDIPLLNIKQGEIIGIVGNNGAGKTTLFRLMLDLIRPTFGCVEIDGINVLNNDLWKKKIGSYLDDSFVIKHFTVKEFLSFVGSIYKLSNSEMEYRIKSFEKFMTNEIVGNHKYIHELSSGNRQKVGIVAAMIMHPEFLILDEPFNFIDPTSQIELKRLLKELNVKQGVTIIISSHNIEHIIELSSRVILLEKGKIIKDINNDIKSSQIDLQHYFEIS